MKMILISAALLFINVSCFGVVTQTNQSNKMVYLRIMMIENKPTQISSEILEGKIKTPKVIDFKPNQIFYEVLSNDNLIITEGVIEDPSLRIMEYINESGELNTVEVKQDSSEMLIRINYNDKISTINLFKIPETNSLKKNREEFLPIGSFPIKLD